MANQKFSAFMSLNFSGKLEILVSCIAVSGLCSCESPWDSSHSQIKSQREGFCVWPHPVLSPAWNSDTGLCSVSLNLRGAAASFTIVTSTLRVEQGSWGEPGSSISSLLQPWTSCDLRKKNQTPLDWSSYWVTSLSLITQWVVHG